MSTDAEAIRKIINLMESEIPNERSEHSLDNPENIQKANQAFKLVINAACDEVAKVSGDDLKQLSGMQAQMSKAVNAIRRFVNFLTNKNKKLSDERIDEGIISDTIRKMIKGLVNFIMTLFSGVAFVISVINKIASAIIGAVTVPLMGPVILIVSFLFKNVFNGGKIELNNVMDDVSMASIISWGGGIAMGVLVGMGAAPLATILSVMLAMVMIIGGTLSSLISLELERGMSKSIHPDSHTNDYGPFPLMSVVEAFRKDAMRWIDRVF